MILIDSSFWIALRDRRDRNHQRAGELIREVLGNRWPIVITDFIFAETHAYFIRSIPLRRQIMKDLLENPVVRFEPIEARDRQRAFAFLQDYDDKDWAFCDALSFVIIERLGIKVAASFDHHFGQPGTFEVLK